MVSPTIKSTKRKTLKIFSFIAVSLPILIGLSSESPAQARKSAEVKSIDAYCKTVDAIRKKHKKPDLIFADTADTNEHKEKWRKFASEKALDKFRENSETYSIAYNWQSGGRVVASNFTLFSGSGDWAKYVYHYFRQDGSLARVESELRTFYGDYIVSKYHYFDPQGRLIDKSFKYLDLQTKKPKKPTAEFIGENSTWDEVDYYKKTSKLPFVRHLPRGSQ